MRFKHYLTEMGFKKYPKGWDESSAKKFAETLSNSIGKNPKEKGWFDTCTLKMRKEMGEGAKGFCASLLDTYKETTFWRGKHGK